jgi:hypothetical protein
MLTTSRFLHTTADMKTNIWYFNDALTKNNILLKANCTSKSDTWFQDGVILAQNKQPKGSLKIFQNFSYYCFFAGFSYHC